jgi:hypothetical protein
MVDAFETVSGKSRGFIWTLFFLPERWMHPKPFRINFAVICVMCVLKTPATAVCHAGNLNLPESLPCDAGSIPTLERMVTVNRTDLTALAEIIKRIPKAKFMRLSELLKANTAAGDITEVDGPLNCLAVRILKRVFDDTVTVSQLITGEFIRNRFG